MIAKAKEIINAIKSKWQNLTILDKYIYRQLFEVFLLGVVVFTSIIFASEAFTQLMKQISTFGIPANIATMMVVLNLPQVFVLTIPISVLFAVLMTINKLSLNSEITVMRACGVGIDRIAKPVFIFALIATVASFLINEFVVPAASTQAKHLAIYSLQKKHIPEGKKNYTLKEARDGIIKRLFYVQECKDKTLTNITVLDLSNKDVVQLIQANTGRTDKLGWRFEDGIVYTLSNSGKVFNSTLFEDSTINFGLENSEGLVKERASQYNYFKLAKHIYKNRKNKDFIEKLKTQYQIDLHDKIALPMTTMVLALIAMPLAITPPRVRYNRGFLFSVIIIFFYYVIRAFSLNLGGKVITPFLAAWLPVVIIGLIGGILYYRKAYKIT